MEWIGNLSLDDDRSSRRAGATGTQGRSGVDSIHEGEAGEAASVTAVKEYAHEEPAEYYRQFNHST